MFYYQVVFNRPYFTNYNTLGDLSYTSETEIALGSRVTAELGSTMMVGLVVDMLTEDSIQELVAKKIKMKSILSVVDTYPMLNEDQILLAKWMAHYYLASWGECIFTMLPSAKQERTTKFSDEIISHFETIAPQLTQEQENCINQIKESYQDNSIDMVYLYGITGSGKTEVFLSSIATILENSNKQVIYLMPEIALVLQSYPLFCARFDKNKVAVIHSGLTKSQKLTEWNRIKSGEARIVIGVRSAIFAPVENLGAVIIDEEHDGSYKSGTTPRYHARHIAMKRCQQHKSLLIMGSATPSIEAWAYKEQESMKFLQLTKRVAGGALPSIELLSLQNTSGCLTVPLFEEMKATIQQGKQVLLLLNRRGYSQMYLCRDCGDILACPNCSVNLTFHKEVSNPIFKLQCHHCGHHQPPPDSCPKCGFVNLGTKGWGTQRVVQEIEKLFSNAIVERFDADVSKSKEDSINILGRFYRKEIDILVGTQMVAKGMNFPHLQLVGVLFGDGLLGLPDFRSEERAYSLIQQVAGRAGRFNSNGKVIIQGYGLDNRVFVSLFKDIAVFYDEEVQRRKKYNLVPFQRFFRIVFRGKQEENTKHIADVFASSVQQHLAQKESDSPACTILGPVSCLYTRLSNNYRYQVILSSPSQNTLIDLCRAVLSEGVKAQANRKKVYLELDPDPLVFS